VNVAVAYAGPEGIALVHVQLREGASVADAIEASRIVDRLALFEAALGYAIFGQAVDRATPVREGDRVELLRPLVADPKESRRRRAAERPLPRPIPGNKGKRGRV
jgi:putative ubiquitin-RnfH superfamily antitoxin RatB of RatAB toxin-antitoxin module